MKAMEMRNPRFLVIIERLNTDSLPSTFYIIPHLIYLSIYLHQISQHKNHSYNNRTLKCIKKRWKDRKLTWWRKRKWLSCTVNLAAIANSRVLISRFIQYAAIFTPESKIWRHSATVDAAHRLQWQWTLSCAFIFCT